MVVGQLVNRVATERSAVTAPREIDLRDDEPTAPLAIRLAAGT